MLNEEKLDKEKLDSKKLNSKKLNKEKLDKEKERKREGKCYGSALARAALVPIGLGLASLGYLSMQCFMFPTSFLSFI